MFRFGRVSKLGGWIRTNICACRVYSGRRNESPRPESNRITPRTRRVLDHREAWARSHAGQRVRGARARGRRELQRVVARVEKPLVSIDCRVSCRWTTDAWASGWSRTSISLRVGPLPSGRELQREESNLRDDRLTAGCLTIRLRWNDPPAMCGRVLVRQVFREHGPRMVAHAWLGSGRRSRTCVSGFRDQRPAS